MSGTEQPERDELAAIASGQTIARQTIAGMRWSVVGVVSRQSIQFLAQLTLARLLAPADFGLLGMALAFGAFATVLIDGSFGPAIIQAPTLSRVQLSGAFWGSTAIGLLAAASMFAAAGPLGHFYHRDEVPGLLRLLCITYLFGGLMVVPEAMLYRQLRLKVIATIELVSTAGGAMVGIFFALTRPGPFCLAWQLVAAATIECALTWMYARWRPAFTLRPEGVRDLTSFSARILAFNILNFGARNADNILIGRWFGATNLGFYARAYSFLLLISQTAVGVVGRVATPAFARMDDPERIRDAYLRAIGTILLIVAPLGLGAAASAPDLVVFLLGSRWLPMVPYLRVFGCLVVAQAALTTTGWIYISRGRPDLQLRWGLGAIPLIVLSFFAGARFGSAVGVAVAYALTTGAVLFYPAFAYVGRLIGLRPPDVLRAIREPLAAAVAMVLVVALMVHTLPFAPAARFGVEVMVGALTYAAAIVALRAPQLGDLAEVLPSSVSDRPIFVRYLMWNQRSDSDETARS